MCTEDFEEALEIERTNISYLHALRETVFVLITVASVTVLIAVYLLPVLRIYGVSMSPTLEEGSFVVCVKSVSYQQGDVCAFYYNNKVLVKRVIACTGDWVDISEDGTVYVNGEKLDEPYVTEPALGECDIELPYQVPELRAFVMGDRRADSVDSRSSLVGAVSEEQILGKIVFCVWPLDKVGFVK